MLGPPYRRFVLVVVAAVAAADACAAGSHIGVGVKAAQRLYRHPDEQRADHKRSSSGSYGRHSRRMCASLARWLAVRRSWTRRRWSGDPRRLASLSQPFFCLISDVSKKVCLD